MYKGKKIIAIIPARANSKRCPGKNLRILNDKPLVNWSIDGAINSKFIDKIVVTTDDDAILQMASDYNDVFALNRPAELATDDATSLDVVMHVLSKVKDEYDYGILLQPTSPFRTVNDIDTSIESCIDANAKTCVSYTKLSKPSSFFYGSVGNDIEHLSKYDELYQLNGAIYLFEIKHLISNKKFNDASTLRYTMPEIRAIDIDTEEDFLIAAHLAGAVNDRN